MKTFLILPFIHYFSDRINLLGNQTHLPSTTLSNNANRSSFTTTAPNTTTFDYLYEFSETRKVLEDFFKCPTNEEEKKITDCFNESDTGSLVSCQNNKIFNSRTFYSILTEFVGFLGQFE